MGAHPDDLEILCGGTMALYTAMGVSVTMCTATSGNRGGGAPARELGETRREEARRAAGLIGAEYEFLGLDDCEVDDGLETRARFIELIRDCRPDIIFTHDPGDYHPDHVATSRQVLAASFVAAVPMFESATGASSGIPPVLYMDTLAGVNFEPEQYVDISAVINAKRAMLQAHASQVAWFHEHDDLDIIHFAETMSAFRGLQIGTAYAEAFRPARLWLRRNVQGMLPGS